MYGYGLLGYRDNSFYQMDAFEFLQQVDGAMQWQLEQEDRLFEQFSIFTAQQMLATGNMKKNTDIKKLTKQLYMPLEERRSGSTGKIQYVGEEKVAEMRAELMRRFKK